MLASVPDDPATITRDSTDAFPTLATALRRLRDRPALWWCPICDSSLVQPVRSTAPRTGSFQVARRCPECGRHDVVHAGPADVHEYDRRLIEGHLTLAAEYRRIATTTMREDADRITCALRSGALQPFDF